MSDARFEDGGEQPLSLKAETEADLGVISTLAQDAVLTGDALHWDRRGRVFSALLNRFRWEDRSAAQRAGRPYERVQAALAIGSVLRVRQQGLGQPGPDTVLSLLAVEWQPGADGAGQVVLVLAGDGAIALEVECLDITLRDLSRPYEAPSGQVPQHPA